MPKVERLAQGTLVELKSGGRFMVTYDNGQFVKGWHCPVRKYDRNGPVETTIARRQVSKVLERAA